MRALLFALVLAPVAAAHGQLRYGLTGGINSAKLTRDNGGESSMRRAPMFGVVALWEAGPTLGIETGLLYAQQGTKARDTGDGFDVRGEMKLAYVQIPVQAKLSLGPYRARFRPFVSAGPALGIKVGCKLIANVGELRAELPCDDPDVDADINTADFSFVGGAGIDIRDLTIGVRYWHGLTAISDAEEASGAKNRVITLSGTLFFSSDRRR